jgi:hypothetical protein
MAFSLSTSVSNPWLESQSFSPVAGTAGGPITVGQSIGLSTTATVWKRPNAAELLRLEKTLEDQRGNLPAYALMGIFRSALEVRNPVDRFLCLYNILLLKQGDSQARVDAFIRSEQPGVVDTASPHKPGVMETVYTRLRNEFAHIRPGTSFTQTRNEMEQQLGGLKALAHKACLLP